MHAKDRDVLLEIAERPETEPDASPHDPTSPTRMSRVAMAVVKHAEEFNLDHEAAGDALPVETYISSYLADVLHLADLVRSGEAKGILEEAIHFSSETTVYDSLRGLRVG